MAALSAASIAFFSSKGWLLYYGDAAAHINIARRILDSRTPGWGQVGTVWLPLPHLLMVPFVHFDGLWQSGLAGSIPAGLCFVAAGVLLFLATRRVFGDGSAAATASLVLALNANLLYLQSIPMTEAFFLAILAAVLYCSVRYGESGTRGALIALGASVCAATLTRYEGWFLIPFAGLYVLLVSREDRWKNALIFSAVASLGPLGWLIHNLFFFGNALEFYNGASSAKGIYQRALDAGLARYPGDHNWKIAAEYLRAAIRLCAGTPLVYLGVAGAAIALLRRAVWPLVLLALPPLFYVWSMHSGGTPIFMPQLWPHSYYNTRYGTTALPLLAFAAAALVTLAPRRIRKFAAALVIFAAASPWLGYPRPEAWICWKESQVNSESRRAWTQQAADYLRANYHRGEGILTGTGDLTSIYREAGIPLRETLNDCNFPYWGELTKASNPVPRERWAVAIAGDTVATTLQRAEKAGARYDRVKDISVKGAPVIEIYRRR